MAALVGDPARVASRRAEGAFFPDRVSCANCCPGDLRDVEEPDASPPSASAYFQVTSMPKKCMNTSRAGLFFGFCCGLRM
jgi:hypothetical protein